MGLSNHPEGRETCDMCYGNGTITCPSCNGFGLYTGKYISNDDLERGIHHPCPSCNGARVVTCFKCGGRGVAW
jgi:hypothetical protein